jgi:protocatechuate 3,4-dioxygenase beta subunit
VPGIKDPGIGDYAQLASRAPTYNLKHFKIIFDNHLVNIARYYPGANVTGTVLDANNDPISGLTVEIMDENGTPHDHTITDEKGRYSLTAIEGNLTIAATMKGGMIAENRIDVTHEQAMRQVDYRIKSDIKVTAKEFKGSLVGRAFIDNNQNMIFDEDEGDTLATNGTVTIISQEDYSLLRSMAGETQEAQLRAMMGISVITANITDGAFKFEDIDVGGYAVFVSSNEYAGTSFAVINAGKETEVDVPLAYSPEEAAQFLQFSQLGQMGQLGNLGQLGQPGQPGNLGQLGQLANILNQSAGEENITTETVPIETPEPIQEDEPIPEEKPE